VIIAVWATPGARTSELTGVQEGLLRVRIAAPAAEGRANRRLREFLARRLQVPPSTVTVVAGGSSRRKQVAVAGMSPDEVIARLGVQ
jgi:uncharacterized protein